MKKNNLAITIILLFSLTYCTKEEIEKSKDVDPQATINGSWKLSAVVNLSDEGKYLNSVLELNSNHTYKLSDNSGAEIVTSSFKNTTTDITFSNGLFEGLEVTLQLIKLSGTELWLQEHYTFDNKDSYIEYHWTKN